MPKNRGKEGRDSYLFGKNFMQDKIKEAVFDMSFLLERGYGESSSCELVGNRHKLNKRQQQAIKGMSAAKTAVIRRKEKALLKESLSGKEIIVDGFNQIILLESMLSNAYLFEGKDGAIRDLSSLHGTYKSVNQTEEAISLIGDFFKNHNSEKIIWIFDKPVSNSGRMKAKLLLIAKEYGYNWEVILENNPDKLIAKSNLVAITSDAWILDRVESWFNLMKELMPDDYEFVVTS
ncbi:DUF434 domain-containing protein [Tenacibaculum tangerinum]|uniref:DUF434 domain-containing protein n=1 Tax=Tenacibaculum tangerinum TaxID=3038772 RepID=A0ABY8L4U7_9FLAO|nr:DUF434 domain-containing protein [Tenacibaculum tangerinum]WGH76452.1 DUF434 domain-containing protein [Tenacibaculum tangerinum]